MIKQGTGGKIINTSSVAGRQGYQNIAPYCATKFAVISLNQSGAHALAEAQDHGQWLRPGRRQHAAVEATRQGPDGARRHQRPGEAAELLRREPCGARRRSGHHRHDDVPRGPDSDYMTGQIIMIDGGMVLV